MVRRAKQLDTGQGIKSSPNPEQGKAEVVKSFYNRHEVGTVMSSRKKDYIFIKVSGVKIHEPKQMLWNLK
jgi:hypothetical protein